MVPTLFLLGFTPNETHSVECSAPTTCALVKGRSTKAIAWGRFQDGIASAGTAKLWVSTAVGGRPETAAFAAGYLEGALSAERIYQQYSNFVHAQGIVQPSANLTRWLDDNAAWISKQVAAAAQEATP